MYERFRDAGVKGIHRHVIAVIRCPAECKFGQIAGTDNKSVLEVGQIHQDLCALTRLHVLVGHILCHAVMTDVFEVLLTSGLD